MGTRPALVVISTAQLGAGVAGHVIAVRDGRPFNVALIGWQGRADRVARDSVMHGTGLSAPVYMLAIQAAATTRLASGPSRKTTRFLGGLGAAMCCGYLIEEEFRNALSPAGWDRRITPVAAAGLGLSAAMALVGLKG